MNPEPKTNESPMSTEERLQDRARSLLGKLAGQYSTGEIEAEMSVLNDLVDDLRERDELLEKLLNLDTPTPEIRQIAEALPDPILRIVDNRRKLDQLHAVSHKLIQRSVQLVTTAQRLVDQSRNRDSAYALEVCAFCQGFGGTKNQPCPACLGKRTVLVYQPALICPRCNGTGKPPTSDLSMHGYEVCLVCSGSGWALTLAERKTQTEL